MRMSSVCVIQHDAMDCGAACLTMIFKYYGLVCSLEDIEQICCPTSEGISINTLSETAQHYGFHTICGRLRIDDLRSIDHLHHDN